jgi:hypothetical protein
VQQTTEQPREEIVARQPEPLLSWVFSTPRLSLNPSIRDSSGSGHPVFSMADWISADAGMT